MMQPAPPAAGWTARLRRLRQDLASLATLPAAPRDAMLALAVLVAGVAAAGVTMTRLGSGVQVLDGEALTLPDGRPRSVTALQWDSATLLSIGTAGAGVVTWDAATGALLPDPVVVRAGRTVLALPPLPPGAGFVQRPAVTLRTTVPTGDEVPVSEQENQALAASVLGGEGRLPVLTFSQGGTGPVPEHAVSDRIAVGAGAVLTDLAVAGPDFPVRFISTQDGQPSRDDDLFRLAPLAITSMVTTADGTAAVLGGQSGSMFGLALEYPTTGDTTPAIMSTVIFRGSSGSGDAAIPDSAVTALAISGSGDQVAAAAEDGRIILLRAREVQLQAQQTPPGPTFDVEAVGIAPPDLWVEPVPFAPGTVMTTDLVPLGFSLDGQAFTFEDVPGNRFVQVDVGGTRQAEIPIVPRELAPEAASSDFVNWTAPVIANLPLLDTAAILQVVILPDLQTFADAAGGAVVEPPPKLTLRDALPWQLPLSLADTKTLWSGSALDPGTRRAVIWGEAGEVYLLSPDSEDLGPDLGTGTAVADAAFEPVSGALIVLSPDGTAFRITDGNAPGVPLTYPPPVPPDKAPPPDAQALSFPPDEAVTLVLWSRTATAPAFVRRYDRATAAPLDEGLDVGFEYTILPDHSALLLSTVNGEELLVRDARTGGTVLHALFEGGGVELAPSPDARSLGIVRRGDAIWTLRLTPLGGGFPLPYPADLTVSLLHDQIAVPLAGGVAKDGLWLSAAGETLLVRARNGRMFVARPAEIPNRDNDLPCCIPLRRLLWGLVATDAVLLPAGDVALVAGVDQVIWRVDLETDDAAPLLQMAGPVRAMALSSDGARLAVAAEGAAPVVIDLARAGWLSGLPVIGHAPYATPLPLGPRYLPDRGLPAGADPDMILLAVLLSRDEAIALRATAAAMALDARILRSGNLYLVTLPLEGRSPLASRAELARARAMSPVTRGAMLHRDDQLCPGTATLDEVAERASDCGLASAF